MSGATATARRRSGPLSPLVAALPALVGVVLVVFGWVGVSGRASFANQTAPLNVAILGALVVFAGCGFYLFAFRRRIRTRIAAARLRTLPDEDQ